MNIQELLGIALGAILVNNFIFSQFLGICPFMGVSKSTDTATGMGLLWDWPPLCVGRSTALS